MRNDMTKIIGMQCPAEGCNGVIINKNGFDHSQSPKVQRYRCSAGHHKNETVILASNPDLSGEIESRTEDLDVVEEHRLRKELKEARAQIKILSERTSEQEEMNHFLSELKKRKPEKPRWTLPIKGKTQERAIAHAMLSDTHFDEVVNPAEVSNVNAYNREIGTARLQRFFRNTMRLSKEYINGIQIDGLVAPMGGDMVSGNIHEELAISNHAEIMDTVMYWTDQIVLGYEKLLTQFSDIHVPCVIGNHGRNKKKWRNKGAAQDNFDWLIYHLVAKRFAGQDGITFDIPLDTGVQWDAYTKRLMMVHGNEFRGGTGVGGIAVPILRGNYKKQQNMQAVKRPYDYLLIGHFHQFMDLGSVLINGSLKGYDEYCRSNNFGFESPRQMFFLIDPKWGKTISAPIHVQSDSEHDLWQKYGAANQPQWLLGDAA